MLLPVATHPTMDTLRDLDPVFQDWGPSMSLLISQLHNMKYFHGFRSSSMCMSRVMDDYPILKAQSSFIRNKPQMTQTHFVHLYMCARM